MPFECNESREAGSGDATDRRDFLRGGVALAGGVLAATAAMELVRTPAPAFGKPRPKIDRPTCVARDKIDTPGD